MKHRRRRPSLSTLGLVAGIALGTLGGAGTAGALALTGPAEPAAKTLAPVAAHSSWARDSATITTGCVIRFYPDGPAIHENGAHACTGATGVWIHPTSGALVIDNPYELPVVAAIAQADETLVRRGITAGISGGVGDAHVMFHYGPENLPLDLNIPAHYRLLVGPYANLWYTNTQVGDPR